MFFGLNEIVTVFIVFGIRVKTQHEPSRTLRTKKHLEKINRNHDSSLIMNH